MRGMGRIFKRGSVYWVAYYHRGKEHRESSHSESEKEARRLLKKRIGEVGTGRFTGATRGAAYVRRPRQGAANGLRNQPAQSVRSARLSISHLRKFVGLERAIDITTDRVKAYAASRQREGAANASINRELAGLKRNVQSSRSGRPAEHDALHPDSRGGQYPPGIHRSRRVYLACATICPSISEIR